MKPAQKKHLSLGAQQANERRHLEAIKRHRDAALHCEYCGVAFWRKKALPQTDARRFCSKQCSGAMRTALAAAPTVTAQRHAMKEARKERAKAESEIQRTIAVELNRAFPVERKPGQKRWTMFHRPRVVHVCPDCGTSFLGHERRVYCSVRCGKRMMHKGRYPPIGAFGVIQRNEMASLIALMRAAQRKLQDAV